MKFRTLLTIHAAVLGGSGISAVLLPDKVCSLYGVAITSEVTMMAQYAGLGSLGIALVAWFSREVADPITQRAIVRAFVVTYVIGVIISVRGTISGVMELGWPVVGLYASLTIAYTYFFMKQRKEDSDAL